MKFLPVLGRLLFVTPMLIFGFGHLGDAQTMVDNGMVPSFLPAPILIVYATGGLLIFCAISIAIGYKTKQAALALAIYLAGTTFLVWAPLLSSGDQVAFGMFMKDLSLTGAALFIAHFGAGPMSMEAKKPESATGH